MTNKSYTRLTPRNAMMCGRIGGKTFLNRLFQLENAIDDGTLVFLPCRVGNTVYEVFPNHCPPFIQQTKIEKVIITGKGLRLKLERNSTYETSITALGKTLFLSKEAAERELKERIK